MELEETVRPGQVRSIQNLDYGLELIGGTWGMAMPPGYPGEERRSAAGPGEDLWDGNWSAWTDSYAKVDGLMVSRLSYGP
jgi:hypothetical protein